MTKIFNPIIDPSISYFDNIENGPFGEYLKVPKYSDNGEPSYDFIGHKLYVPFGIPAGPLPTSRHINAAFNAGFDVAVYKTVRSREFKGNPLPNVFPVQVMGDISLEQATAGIPIAKEYTEPIAITNSYGVPSPSPDFWQADMKKSIETTPKGKLVIGSFQGTPNGDGNVDNYINDFGITAQMVAETGAQVMEVNLSCPNEGSAHLLCFDIDRSIRVVDAIKNKIGNTALFIKLAYFAEKEALQKLVAGTKDMAAGYSVINTIGSRVVTEKGDQAFPGEGRAIAGVSGNPIRWAGLEMVATLDGWRKELGLSFSIIGVGGVLEPSHYTAYRQAGADVVLSAAGTMWNPYLARKIKENL